MLGFYEAMAKVKLSAIVDHCETLLGTRRFDDWPGAANGLQVQNQGVVTRLATAVDATLATVRQAVALRADLLLVHHGLFWGPSHPWTAKRYELFGLLWSNNLAVYSSHLPLDAHPRLGNNAQLCAGLGIKGRGPFFLEKGQYIGYQGQLAVPRDALARRLGRLLGHEPLVVPGGPLRCQRVGILTGAGGAELRRAADEGIDTYITGEGPHWTFGLAEELGLNVFYGGHYATETFGVKALGAHLAKRFHLPWHFIDYPTGL
jgi:dinuclear metal center YbgI/SA1388 family protein